MILTTLLISITYWGDYGECRDEEKIMKACYWPNEVYEACFAGCAEVSCDNPRAHLRPCYPYCEPGCVCNEPYVRDDRTHQCVLPQDCSPTQMGIPVPTKRSEKSQQTSKYSRNSSNRVHGGQDDSVQDFIDPDQLTFPQPMPNTRDDFKRPEVSRMGNYFNIVIAPPPIKALQPRKIVDEAYASPGNRFPY